MLTQIDVIYETLVLNWTSAVTYDVGRRVLYGGVVYEAQLENTNTPPVAGGNAYWLSLGANGPLSEEAALALPILGITPKSSLIVRKVTGLNPPDIDLFIGEYARDGGMYQGRRVKERNVVMTIDLNPDPALGETVRGLRELLYKVFMDPLVDADHIELVLHDDDGGRRNLFGYAEAFETEIFDIETLAQISFICPDPYLSDLVETELSNNSGIWTKVPFTYQGTAETGFKTTINVSQTTNVLTLANNGRTMVFNHPFFAGDVVHINTIRGERSLTYVRGGVTYPLIAKLSPTSRWLELHSKINTMSVYGATPTTIIGGVKTLSYRAKYWGV